MTSGIDAEIRAMAVGESKSFPAAAWEAHAKPLDEFRRWIGSFDKGGRDYGYDIDFVDGSLKIRRWK